MLQLCEIAISIGDKMKKHNQLMGACGLDCKECDVFRAPNNPSVAHEIVEWVKKQRAIEMRPQDIHCLGCKGDRAKHWSPDCWILKCCVDKEGLEFCHQCHSFPCDKLNEWAKGSRRYGEALSQLKKMKRDEEGSL
jgi:hypothetical protein